MNHSHIPTLSVQTELTELDQLTEERAALLDKCSASETQLRDVMVHILYWYNVCAWMSVHKLIIQFC